MRLKAACIGLEQLDMTDCILLGAINVSRPCWGLDVLSHET